jgi:hypothetical protein
MLRFLITAWTKQRAAFVNLRNRSLGSLWITVVIKSEGIQMDWVFHGQSVIRC